MNDKRERKPKRSAPHTGGGPEGEHRSDRPAGRDQPGTGQPNDELTAPPEVREAQGILESAVETGFARPQPVEVPEEEERKPEAAERAARHAEEKLDRTGLE